MKRAPPAPPPPAKEALQKPARAHLPPLPRCPCSRGWLNRAPPRVLCACQGEPGVILSLSAGDSLEIFGCEDDDGAFGGVASDGARTRLRRRVPGGTDDNPRARVGLGLCARQALHSRGLRTPPGNLAGRNNSLARRVCAVPLVALLLLLLQAQCQSASNRASLPTTQW